MKLEIDRNSNKFVLGIALVALGGLALLGQIGFFRSLSGLLAALLFGGAGYYLVRRYFADRSELWALLGGFVLLGLGAAALPGPLSGMAFLGIAGAGFAVAYHDDPARWWAVIPAGVLLSLALVSGADRLMPGVEGAAIFMLGLAATFWYLYRLPGNPKQWAIYPSVAAVIIAVVSLASEGGWLLPLVFIAGGLYLLVRQQNEGSSSADAPRTSPAPAHANGRSDPLVAGGQFEGAELAAQESGELTARAETPGPADR